MATAVLDGVTGFLSEQHGLLIAGEETGARSGERFDVVNPATGESIGSVPSAGAADVDDAVAAAREAFPAWRDLAPARRAELLWNLGTRIAELADELAQLESLDNGKPVAEALVVDVPLCSELFRYYAGWATKIEGAVGTPSFGSFHTYMRREPIGVVGAIIPWNFPLLMCGYKLGPALAAGNTVVLKPAEQTPMSALRLAELITEVGFPPGVVNVITGFGETAGAPLASHGDVDKITFTGEHTTGQKIVEAAKGNLKRVSLELGGKSPSIVFGDADLDAALEGTHGAVFFNQGQCCIAGARVFVHQSVKDEFAERLVDRARSIRLGSGLDPDTDMGPLVSAEQLDRVSGLRLDRHRGGRDDRPRGRPSERRGARGRLLRPADRLHGRRPVDAHHARGDLRPGRDGRVVLGRGRGGRPCERHALRPRGRDLDEGREARAPCRRAGRGRHGLGEHVRDVRRCHSLRWLQAVGVRQGARPRGARAVPADEDRLGRPELNADVSFCESLREECSELWEGLHRHPFLREMAAGTLPLDTFRFFVEQDLHFFLPDLSRAVAIGAAVARDERELRHFAEELVAVVERESENNRVLLGRLVEMGAADRGGSTVPGPANVAYSGYIVSTAARGGPLEIMTVLLPCTWGYADIGLRLQDEIVPHPVYADWVGFLASEEYVELIASRRRTLDELAARTDDGQRRSLTETFRMATRLEHLFWDMAYRCEQWPDVREER